MPSDGCLVVQCLGRVEASKVLQAPCAAPPLRTRRRYGLGCECPNLARIEIFGLAEVRLLVGNRWSRRRNSSQV